MMIMPRATLNQLSGKLRRAFQLRPRHTIEQTLTKLAPSHCNLCLDMSDCEKKVKKFCILDALDVSLLNKKLELVMKCDHD